VATAAAYRHLGLVAPSGRHPAGELFGPVDGH